MEKLKRVLRLFLAMFKIGLFTFGGGYAMIAIIEREIVEKKQWINHDEFVDLIAIAESTPGPLAINSATYVGYKIAGVLGSVFATLGVVLPSFIIIFIISLFFDAFLAIEWVAYAFRGIQAAVAFLILNAGIKMLKKVKKSVFGIIMTSLTVLCFVTLSLLAVSFSSIFYILIGGVVGLTAYLITYIKTRKQKTIVQMGSDLNDEKEGE
ncbi:MAG: chromate transporter [Clostridiales bacterium]|nr:chromate transporter [Clostridiales bacterium]